MDRSSVRQLASVLLGLLIATEGWAQLPARQQSNSQPHEGTSTPVQSRYSAVRPRELRIDQGSGRRAIPIPAQDARELPPRGESRLASYETPVRGNPKDLGSPAERIPLLPPDNPDRLPSPAPTPGGALWKIFSSLAIVLGLFFAVLVLARRGRGSPIATLPKEAFEMLGRAPLHGRQQAQLIRLGDKLILLAVTPTGAEPIGEVTTPAEVDRIAGLCQQQNAHSASATFQQVLHQFAREPAPQSFIGDSQAESITTESEETLSEFERLA